MKKISILIPIFNECYNIIILHTQIEKVISKLTNYNWEYIFINDGSTDNSLNILLEINQKSNNIKIIDFSRNFGKEAALTAGVHNAIDSDSDAVICIDADLQHPPELIPMLIKEWNNGFEVIEAIREKSINEPFFRKMGSSFYYFLMNKFTNVKISTKTTDFRLCDKKVISNFAKVTEHAMMFRGIIDWMGFKRKSILFVANERLKGQTTKFTYLKLISLAVNSISSFSLLPLKITGFLGIVISILSVFLGLIMIIDILFKNYYNFSSISLFIVFNTFLIGLVLISIGIVAHYIGLIHTEAINRPLYIISSIVTSKVNG